MKDEDTSLLAARVPKALLKKLDRAAKRSDRTRSAELRVRLEDSFSRGERVNSVKVQQS
jgi:predicted transcriptional regulator